MEDIFIKIRVLIKAEMILFRLQLRRTLQQTAIYVAAALLVVLAAGMLNIALFLSLAPRLDNAGAALAVALVDILLAVAAVIVAGRLRIDPEVDAVQALRESTIASLTADADHVKAQITDLQDDIKRIRSAVTGLTTFGGVDLTMLFQWVPMLLRLLLRRKTE
jgi:hypothetical protein